MINTAQKHILDKAHHFNVADAPASSFMVKNFITLREHFSIRSTIETFRIHHLSGAPIVDEKGQLLGIVSEYDLLIQAATKKLSANIDFQVNVKYAYPETTLKEVLILLYKQRLKWIPVIEKSQVVVGIVSRIDVLTFIAEKNLET
jgi:CBS domain-containing protein